MIVSHRDKRTEDFATGKRIKTFSGFERSAQLRLDRLEAATSVKIYWHCRAPFRGVEREPARQYNICINDQWRFCFEWPNTAPGPRNVEIVDYD